MNKFLYLISFLMMSGLHSIAAIGAVWGDPVSIGGGTVRTYVDLNKDGKPSDLGVAFTAGMLSNLSDGDMEEYVLNLPSNIDLHPFKHVVINWNPHGHEPAEVYGAPHFDFHFYNITRDVQKSISCDGADKGVCLKEIPPEYIPSKYAPTPDGVPTMGWHWIDTLSGEWNGQPFTSTFIYGFYNGLMSFIEPMITREFFLGKKPLESALRLPEKFSVSGYYPNSYAIRYDPVEDMYRVVLQNLQIH